MGLKRPPTEENASTETSPAKKTTLKEPEDEMGEFEDRWEDSEEESLHDSEEESLHDSEEESLNEKMENLQVYLPGGELEEDEVLVADQSTYQMLHQMNVEWPCLSFDILKDKLGNNRSTYPMTTYIVAGSQAENYQDNKVYVMKMSSLQKTINDDQSDSEDDEIEGDDDPVLEFKTIKHEGGVNRVRTFTHADVHVAATMAETGKVHIFDITQEMNAFDTPGLIPPKNNKPIHTITNHGTVEGYGIDWSLLQIGSLLTGDQKGRILMTKKTPNGFISEKQFFTGHQSSIEDIQWSPSQGGVFASCSADKTIRIWDARTKQKPQLTVNAHTTDVNVISWSRTVDYLLASGSDDGQFSVWDLRNWPGSKQTPETTATFHWHQKAITSIEWHPTESSVLACSGADDQLTIWDLALERDEEEEAIMGMVNGKEVQVPPQLLFIHQGQKHIKEHHWHPQIPGMIISTAFDGFNVFKTINS